MRFGQHSYLWYDKIKGNLDFRNHYLRGRMDFLFTVMRFFSSTFTEDYIKQVNLIHQPNTKAKPRLTFPHPPKKTRKEEEKMEEEETAHFVPSIVNIKNLSLFLKI